MCFYCRVQRGVQKLVLSTALKNNKDIDQNQIELLFIIPLMAAIRLVIALRSLLGPAEKYLFCQIIIKYKTMTLVVQVLPTTWLYANMECIAWIGEIITTSIKLKEDKRLKCYL